MDIFNNLKNNNDEVVEAKSVFSRFLIVINSDEKVMHKAV